MQVFKGGQPRDSQPLVVDCDDAGSIIRISANGTAATVRPGEQFPVGAELVFPSRTAKKSCRGVLGRNAEGRLVRERLNFLHLMRKRRMAPSVVTPPDAGKGCKVYRPDSSSDAFIPSG